MKILIIDNYDSFTFNLYQLTAEITNSLPQVYYNDQINFQKILNLHPDAIIISPGPGNPTNIKDFGICSEIITKSTFPILGVCLGHQGIANAFGSNISHAPEIMHGRTSKIYHKEKDLFKNIPQGFTAVRYHSLIIDNTTLSSKLEKTAWTNDNIIMGIKHKTKPLWGVQFHPESIGTQHGKKILENFILKT